MTEKEKMLAGLKDIPGSIGDNVVAVGNPCKAIRKIIRRERQD